MAMRILRKSKITKFRRVDVIQKFNNLLIIDFEATCEKNTPLLTPEIIEFPCVAVNTQNFQVENIFHTYVKPRVNPILSTFCTDLTGIMQETVENEEYFPVVFEKFQKWLDTNGYINNNNNSEHNNSAFVTCGDWDLKVMLPKQCELDKLTVPNYLKQWINLKTKFCDANQYYPRSLKDMLHRLDLRHEGKLHSGLSDSLNMAKIIHAMASKDTPVQFDITSHL